VTEIPEHLLKRSKERRAAIGGEEAGDEAAASSGSAVEPAAASAAEAPAAAAPAAVPEPVAPPPKPVRPEVAAALARRKIPVWALPVLLAIPLWAYIYQGTLEPPPQADDTPIALGGEIYTGCGACHGADGAGGAVGVPLTEVMETWPDYRDHMAWVRIGSAAWPGEVYGAADKAKGPGMPPHPGLSDAQLAEVVLYERATFGGLEETDEEYLALEEIAHGEKTFAEVGLGPDATRQGVTPEDAAG
jgi:mono/diheme cytochrome c family protein